MSRISRVLRVSPGFSRLPGKYVSGGYNTYCAQNPTLCPKPFEPLQCAFANSPPSPYSGSASDFCPGYFTNYAAPVEDPDNDVIDNDGSCRTVGVMGAKT